MAKKETDKRKAQWLLRPGLAQEMEECFKTTAVLLKVTDTNANTWKKLANGESVKKRSARDALEEFLDFLSDYEAGKIEADSSKYYDKEIRSAILKYTKAEIQYEDLMVRDGNE